MKETPEYTIHTPSFEARFTYYPDLNHKLGKGVTTCGFKLRGRRFPERGYAYLSSKDTHDPAKGRKVAFRRAISLFCPEDRANLWRQYFEATGIATTKKSAADRQIVERAKKLLVKVDELTSVNRPENPCVLDFDLKLWIERYERAFINCGREIADTMRALIRLVEERTK